MHDARAAIERHLSGDPQDLSFIPLDLSRASEFHRKVYDFDGSPIHDAVAVAHVMHPELVATKHLNTEIDVESELCRGRTVVDVWRRSGREANSHVGVEIDSEGFLGLLIERLNSLG